MSNVPRSKLNVLRKMIARGLNTIPTSSCGRLFDAAAAIIGMRYETNYEAQAAIELEMCTDARETGAYPFAITEGDPLEIDMRPAVAQLALETSSHVAQSILAARFHDAVAAAVVAATKGIAYREAIHRVCLSGGCFQNLRLLCRVLRGLHSAGLEVYTHLLVPPNDGGIALGQAVVASELLRRNG